MARAVVRAVPATPRPSEDIIKAANKVVEVTDSLGRVLKVRKLSAAHKIDLAILLGAEIISNPYASAPLGMAFSVQAINGDPLAQPKTLLELRAVVARLDDEGMEAVGNAWVDNRWIDGGAPPLEGDDLKN